MSVTPSNMTDQSHVKPCHAVILLAGGLSQRLGHAKQLIHKNQQPLLCHMAQLALTTQPSAVMVVVPTGQPKMISLLEQSVDDKDHLHIITNPAPHIGMAHSLDLGIHALHDWQNAQTSSQAGDIDRVLIMGVDQVLLNQAHLLDLLTAGDKHTCVTASQYPQLGSDHKHDDDTKDNDKKYVTGLPLVVQYDMLRHWQPHLSGDKGLRPFIRALPDSHIARVTQADLSHDIDTPEQWRYAQEQGWIDR